MRKSPQAAGPHLVRTHNLAVRWERMPRRCGHEPVAADHPVIRPVRVVLVFLVGTRREAIPEAPRARGLKGQPAWRTITGQPILVRPREPCAPS